MKGESPSLCVHTPCMLAHRNGVSSCSTPGHPGMGSVAAAPRGTQTCCYDIYPQIQRNSCAESKGSLRNWLPSRSDLWSWSQRLYQAVDSPADVVEDP